jgi:hypothetical protein
VNPPGYQESASVLRGPEGSVKRRKTVQTGVYLDFIIHIPKRAGLISINRYSVGPYRSGLHGGSLIAPSKRERRHATLKRSVSPRAPMRARAASSLRGGQPRIFNERTA